jgi:hypothetical protein
MLSSSLFVVTVAVSQKLANQFSHNLLHMNAKDGCPEGIAELVRLGLDVDARDEVLSH